MDALSYKEAVVVFKARTRMLPLKANFKGSYESLICDRCKDPKSLDTEKHLLEECPATKDIPDDVKVEDIFGEDIPKLQAIVKCIYGTLDL